MTEVRMVGPLFDGRAAAATEAMTHDIEKELAKDAVTEIHSTLQRVLKHPTGYYESRVQASNAGSGVSVSDGGVIYGPWLEGVGSRNATTRFKGYHTFQQVGQDVGQEAEEKANQIALKHMAEMN